MGLGKLVKSTLRGLECRNPVQNPYSVIISALDCTRISFWINSTVSRVSQFPVFPSAVLHVLPCRSVCPNHFQTNQGLAGLVIESKATEKRAQKGVGLEGLLRKVEPQHLRGRDAAFLSLARKLEHPPEQHELPQ